MKALLAKLSHNPRNQQLQGISPIQPANVKAADNETEVKLLTQSFRIVGTSQ